MGTKTAAKKGKFTPEVEQQDDSSKIDEKLKDDEDDLRDPTEQELKESMKPENVPQIETVRGKKRKHHTQVVVKNKELAEQKDKDNIREYLVKWKDDRTAWKFEKRKQIFIQDSLYNLGIIPDDLWDVCLEYLEGSKGKTRELMVERAEKLITELDSCEFDSEEDTHRKTKYERARSILQMLN